MTNKEKDTFVCIDCETTGLDVKNDDVVEFAAIKFNGRGEYLDQIHFLVKPQHSIPEESAKIHNITNEMVANAYTLDRHVRTIRDFVGDLPIVGHMVSFDIKILENNSKRLSKPIKLRNNLAIDTLRLARQYQNSKSNSLAGLCEHFNIETLKAHRALDDVKMNVSVFLKLYRTFSNFQSLENTLSKPIKILYMPFGKYRGSLISSLKDNYLLYINKLKDIDNDLKHTIHQEIKGRKNGKYTGNPMFHLFKKNIST